MTDMFCRWETSDTDELCFEDLCRCQRAGENAPRSAALLIIHDLSGLENVQSSAKHPILVQDLSIESCANRYGSFIVVKSHIFSTVYTNGSKESSVVGIPQELEIC